MNAVSLTGGLLGGAGLFLLGVWLMTEGLRLAAGRALAGLLARWTRTRGRGLLSGIALTAAVQSSTAVTMAAIGFVNAGLLSLERALWVIFGSNIGSTTVGWLVALFGFGLRMESAALPLVGIGMLLHLGAAGTRRGALGMTLAGFGVIFLGIGVLKEAFAGLGSDLALPGGSGALSVLLHVGAGIVVTVLVQSSATTLAIALTAAEGGLIGLTEAAAVVIGANIGTTATAILAALGATAAARRAAAAHVLFNLLAGAVALIALPVFLAGVVALREALALDPTPATTLALFHTAFNVAGVLLMWPLAGMLARWLDGRFRSADEDAARPRYLDASAASVPELGLAALAREVRRLGGIALDQLSAQLSQAGPRGGDRQIVTRLNQGIADFVARLNRATMSAEDARRLALLLRIDRYYETIAELTSELARADSDDLPPPGTPMRSALESFLAHTRELLAACDPEGDGPVAGEETASGFESAYQSLKARILEAGARDEISVRTMEALLRQASSVRRAGEQALKAHRVLHAFASPGAVHVS